MAITQDELGNYYDDSDYITMTDNAQPVTRSMTSGSGVTGGDSFHDFNPTPVVTGSDSFHDFNPTPVQSPSLLDSLFGGANSYKKIGATAGALAGAGTGATLRHAGGV